MRVFGDRSHRVGLSIVRGGFASVLGVLLAMAVSLLHPVAVSAVLGARHAVCDWLARPLATHRLQAKRHSIRIGIAPS